MGNSLLLLPYTLEQGQLSKRPSTCQRSVQEHHLNIALHLVLIYQLFPLKLTNKIFQTRKFVFTGKITIPSSKLLLGFHSLSLVQFLYFRTTSPFLDFLKTKQCGFMMLWRSIVISAIQVLISNIFLISSAWGFGVYDSIINCRSSE